MKLFPIVILGFIFGAGIMPGRAQTAKEIIARAVEAQGGEEALRAIKTQRTIGKTTIFLADTVYRISGFLEITRAPNKSYYESPVGLPRYSKKLIFASNGKMSWTQNDGAEAPYAQPPEEHRDGGGETYPYLLTLEERGIKVKYAGVTEFGGDKLQQVTYTYPDNHTEEVFFDPLTGFLRGYQQTIRTSQGSAFTQRFRKDYRKVGNVHFAHYTESYFPPKERDVSEYEKVEVNLDIDDTVFEITKPPELTSNELAELAGTYFTKAGKHVSISSTGGNLTITMPGKMESALTTITRTRFLYRDGEGHGSWIGNVTFERDEQNQVVQIRVELRNEVTLGRKDSQS